MLDVISGYVIYLITVQIAKNLLFKKMNDNRQFLFFYKWDKMVRQKTCQRSEIQKRACHRYPWWFYLLVLNAELSSYHEYAKKWNQ